MISTTQASTLGFGNRLLYTLGSGYLVGFMLEALTRCDELPWIQSTRISVRPLPADQGEEEWAGGLSNTG